MEEMVVRTDIAQGRVDESENAFRIEIRFGYEGYFTRPTTTTTIIQGPRYHDTRKCGRPFAIQQLSCGARANR